VEVRIVKAEGGGFCPSQWDAWTDSGQYLYLRYRFGAGQVWEYPSESLEEWDNRPPVISFNHGHPLDGCIELSMFCELAGLELDLD
jgi:hypothetical protein